MTTLRKKLSLGNVTDRAEDREAGGDGESETTLAALSDRKLTDVGVRVMRFADAEVLADTDAVVKAIKDELQKPFEKPQIERTG